MARPSPAASLAPVARVSEVREIERRAAPAPLMERAGLAAAHVARDMARGAAKVLVLAGPGNNGGDAFVVARHLREQFFDVTVVFAGTPERLPDDAASAYRAFIEAGGSTVEAIPGTWSRGLVVDGMFGIGLKRAIATPHADWIAWANESGQPILALDVPSGLDADTGLAEGPVIRATATSTFIAAKTGQLTNDGPDLCGTLHVHPLELESSVAQIATGTKLEWPALAAQLPEVLRRTRRNVHKGTFGTLGIIGGAPGMTGAPLLAARAALRVGAGRVRVGFAARSHPDVDFAAPELMLRDASAVLDAGADVYVVGPGLGGDARTGVLLRKTLGLDAPLVLDADALNMIARDQDIRALVRKRVQPTILTPHPAEAARLLARDTRAVQADRLASCIEIAQDLNASVVLKGTGSVLATPDGAWDINATGNAGLSAAGSGDVLSGFVGAMLSQHLAPRDALRYGVVLHGAAADALVARGEGPVGLPASSLADAARDLINAAARSL